MARKSGSFSATTGPKVRVAATRLIAEHGFAAVSMRQIAGEVGLQAGALYSYTPDKQTLLFDLLKDHLDGVIAGWSAVQRPEDPVDQLQAFAAYHLKANAAAPEASQIARMELRNLDAANHAQISAALAEYEAQLAAILEAGAASKAFAVPHAGLAARAVLGLLDGIAEWRRIGDMPDERIERISWNMVRRAVGAKGFQ